MIRRTYLFVPGSRPDRFEAAGALQLDGELIDRPVIERARSILAQADSSERMRT